MRTKATSRHRQPSGSELTRIFFRPYELDELFTDEEIEQLVSLARLSIAGEFFFAMEENPRFRPGNGMKRYRNTDNYIIGIGGRVSDIARYVANKTHRQIVSSKQLPSELSDLADNLVDKIVANARYDLLLVAADAMRSNAEVWYDEALGVWNVSQSCVDEFHAYRLDRKAQRAQKVDDRAWHGRPERDRGRAVPAGVSVSFA